ncbi:MAG TPA: serine/threonine-protein kinase, partial [Verrucomicrobiae bacterium]|nr:serine/threonine-protein kinase [Verrucomicrobiae bacterium]
MKSLPTEQKLFAEALQITSPQARVAYLEGACQGDDALRARVVALLHAAEAAGDFLEVPPTELHGGESSDSSPGEQPGDRIGRYKLLELIGEGGFGMVYMAEQEEPVQRRVALKIIKPGMDSKQVIARFEAERQALALMDHPNIAKVLDGGSTGTGRPFFVMELVRGIRITDYCDQNLLSTKERLDLFVHVCQAVQHAHQKGVIHRDIKPSNILVTVNDGLATPKVIDFGIAKAIGQKLTNKTLFTQFHAFMGTPAYTSPEQAEMSSVDVDTRSDIYSLGVLLYELLTGRPPFDSTELMSAGLDEMRRIIRQVEPPRPSTRLSTLGISEATELSRKRQMKIPELANLLRGELDWVVMKCLEKDRARRYETANGLAADIQRHLRTEPVVARPPSAIYRFKKLVRRHKVASVALAAVALSLLVGFASTSVMYLKARAAEGRAASQAAMALAVNEFLQEDILKQSTARMNYRWRRSLQPPNLLQGLARAEDNVAKRFRRQPIVEAAVRFALGEAYANLGRPSNAIPQLQRALELRKRELGLEHPDTLDTVEELAVAYAYSHDFTNSVELLKVCLPAEQHLFGPNHPKTLQAQALLAETRWRMDRSSASRAVLEAAFRSLGRVVQDNETSYMECAFWLASAYEQEGRKDEAIQLQKELLARMGRASEPLSPALVVETGWLAD